MKKILFAVILLISSAVFAQGLFPELANFGGRERKSPQKTTEAAPSATDSSEENIPDIKASAMSEEQTQEAQDSETTKGDDENITQPEQDLFASSEKKEETEQPSDDSEDTEEKTEDDS